jgi:predicted membrane channel-forming protein YqfA (hemolysin III family)
VIDRSSWLTTALTYRWPDNRWFDLLRIVAVIGGTLCIAFALMDWGPDNHVRPLIYLSIGIGVVLQEGQQYITHADFLVWRLPVLSVQLGASFVAMRRYRSGYYSHGRGRRRGKVVS